MTTFAPNFTPRWKGTYRVGGIQHTLQARSVRGADFGTMELFAGFATSIFTALNVHLMNDFLWLGAEIALTDSETFIPSSTPAAPTDGTEDPGDWSARSRIRALTFSGKGTQGRARASIFGIMYPAEAPGNVGGDGIITPLEDSSLTTVLNILNANFCTNGGVHATFHARGTYKENDHLLKLVRRGTIT